MRVLMVVALNFCIALLAQAQLSPVVIDGKLNDALWQHVTAVSLVPAGKGVPASMGGKVQAVTAGGYLYLSARLPEPGGRVTARSIGVDPVGEGGGEARHMKQPRRITYGAADGEDFVRFILRIYNENDWMLQVGPSGAYTIRWRWTGEHEWYTSDPEKCSGFLVASKLGKEGWSVEAAIPLVELGSPRPGYIQLAVERNRARRPGMPEEWWFWPSQQPTAGVTTVPTVGGTTPAPIYKPAPLGNSQPTIPVGYRQTLPSLREDWTSVGWRNVPVWTLRRNEPAARLPVFPTEVKLVQNGHTLAVLARCIENEGVIARAKERDGAVTGDDSFQVYLATSGSHYVQYAINPRGTLLDAAGHQGSPRLSEPHSEWNSPVRGAAWREPGAWVARVDIPLGPVSKILGEVEIPKMWRVLLMRYRPGRNGEPSQTSVLPITESRTPLCPARYRRMELVSTAPAQLPHLPAPERSGSLAFLPSRIFSSAQRKQMNLSGMLESYFRGVTLKDLEAEKQAWDQVKTLDDWKRFRDRRLAALRVGLGKFPARCPLEMRVTQEFHGNGYRRENLVYQSQPGLWVTANLYLPEQHRDMMPGIIIVHSKHASKTQFELQDMGIIWARAGCAVLVPDRLGFGERIQTYPWDRAAINSLYILGTQLQLTGENLTKWEVWDVMRSVDLLLARKDINQKQIILLGAVAGGGDIAGVAAALDPRIAAVAPFNFGEAEPEQLRSMPDRNQWPLDLADPGWGDLVSTGAIPRATVDEFLPWFICASVAPRRFIYSFELGWHVQDEPAWARYRKVYGFYDAPGNLADAHGFGPYPGPGEAWNIGPAQRRSLYPTLQRWFGIPVPFTLDKSSPLENLAPTLDVDRQPVSDLTVLTPDASLQLSRKMLHEIAYKEGQDEVTAARAKLGGMPSEDRLKWLQAHWAEKLGNIDPSPHPTATIEWSKEMPNAYVEAISLEVEPRVVVPMLLLRPRPQRSGRSPVVVAISEGGKDLFLVKREAEIEELLKGNVAVCLPDVRGTGETSPNPTHDPNGDAIREHNAGIALMLGDTILGERVKDLRTVLTYLESRQRVDGQRIGLWGDSFVPANTSHLLINELPQWRIGPQIEQRAEPLGGLLALLGGLYEGSVRAVAVHSGLASYLSILDDNFAYTPADVVIPGILKVGDIADVAAALTPRPLLFKGLVDSQDQLVSDPGLRRQLEPVYEAYRGTSAGTLSIQSGEGTSGIADWFLKHLR
ncbi:MAG: acetylxylan esterase [Terriglobia bacterium]